MSFKFLAKEICEREGKKKQVNIAQVNEVLAVFSDIICEDEYFPLRLMLFLDAGYSRKKKRIYGLAPKKKTKK